MKLELVNVNYKYIDFLRSFPELNKVMLHKYFESSSGGRKYIGIVFENNGFNYFAPLYSGKKEEISRNCVRYNSKGIRKIKKSRFDIYVISTDKDGNERLENVIKCDCMIPIDSSDIIKYSIKDESNKLTKTSFQKLYIWLTKEINQNKLRFRCEKMYKTKIAKLNGTLDVNHPDYKNCDHWLPYPLLEEKLKEWIKIKEEKDKQKTSNS